MTQYLTPMLVLIVWTLVIWVWITQFHLPSAFNLAMLFARLCALWYPAVIFCVLASVVSKPRSFLGGAPGTYWFRTCLQVS